MVPGVESGSVDPFPSRVASPMHWASACTLASGPAVALQCHVGTITFYPEGGIKSCEIEANHEFRTAAGASLACRGGALLAQHPDGSIESCTLAAPYVAGTGRCEAGARVSLVLMATVAGMAIGGWMSGEIFDLTGSYQAAFLNGIAWNLLNMSIAFWLLLGHLRRRTQAA